MTAFDFSKLGPGDKAPSGETAAVVIGSTDELAVYTAQSDGRTCFETNSTVPTQIQSAALLRFDLLKERIAAVLPRDRHASYSRGLALGLFYGVTAGTKDEAHAAFATIEAALAEESETRGARSYFLAASVGAAVFAGLAIGAPQLPIHPPAQTFLQAIGVGAVGAWTSVLQRSARIHLKPFRTSAQYGWRGLIRILLGASFAFFVVVGVKGQFFLAFAQQSFWALLTFCYIAGVSERFVPDLIREANSASSLKSADQNQ